MRHLLAISLTAAMLGTLPVHADTILSTAALEGDLALVQQHVKAGGNVNDVDKWGWTALTWAVYYNQPRVVKWLLENGADPNFRTVRAYGDFYPGTTAVILAGYYGYDEILKELLKYRADTTVTDVHGKTALDYAKKFNFDACVVLLQAPATATTGSQTRR
ncbi:MAG: ankyrin repeat domain-containing protein [Betaproteobacteria bacterium]